MVQGRLRAVLTTLIPILNRTTGSLAAFRSENIPRHHRSNPAAFFTLQPFSLMESSSSSSSSSSSRRQHGNSGKGKAHASSSISQRQSLKRSLDSGGGYAPDRGSAAGGRAFSTQKRPATQRGAEAAAATAAGDRGEGLTMDDARQALRSLFGHDDFRNGQVRRRTAFAKGKKGVLVLVQHAHVFFQSMSSPDHAAYRSPNTSSGSSTCTYSTLEQGIPGRHSSSIGQYHYNSSTAVDDVLYLVLVYHPHH